MIRCLDCGQLAPLAEAAGPIGEQSLHCPTCSSAIIMAGAPTQQRRLRVRAQRS
jgi:DNA-directed RNA polymerase subunit RPC12/RpoP